MRRVMAGVLLAGILAVVAVAIGTSGDSLVKLVVLLGMPWSLLAVAIMLSDGPLAAVVGVGVAAFCLNLAVITLVARWARRR